ncbi:hypothetical protein HN51_031325 [Arachis hypogaea]
MVVTILRNPVFDSLTGKLYLLLLGTTTLSLSRDMYFLQKLLNLKGDDGFRMNEVLVSLWYIMGLWPLAYSMPLLPTEMSLKSKVPVWPFLLLSCFGGAYALLPYFILWNPPAPPIEETKLKSWPLIFLESKVTTVIRYSKVDILCSEIFQKDATPPSGSTVEMIDLDRDDAGSEDANLLFSGHRARITCMRDRLPQSDIHSAAACSR